jgi:arginase
MNQFIQIISAPSILGLKPSGVENLPENLLLMGLSDKLQCKDPIVRIPDLNSKYSFRRDPVSNCLNSDSIREFSLMLMKQTAAALNSAAFPLVLGGDCSILLGIMPALKQKSVYGLIFCDAHADFYQPKQSVTGQVADMDLALITGRGPQILVNIEHQCPYITDDRVIHIGQRDWEETKKYKSDDIKKTAIQCIDYEFIRAAGIQKTTKKTLEFIHELNVDAFWIHFDTDVLSDDENPAVDYRIPGGLRFDEYEQFLKGIIPSKRIAGMSVTIFNPSLDDENGTIAKRLTGLLVECLKNISAG